jgi:hypothetical protein
MAELLDFLDLLIHGFHFEFKHYKEINDPP